MTFNGVINELQYRVRECLMSCHVLLFLSIKTTLGSDCCDILLSSSGSCRWIWGSRFIHEMVLWSFGNLLLPFGLSLWEEVVSFCLTPISTQTSTLEFYFQRQRQMKARWAFQEAGPHLQGLSDAGHLQSQEKFPVITFCSKHKDPTCAQHTRWARCSDRIRFPQFSPQTCK